MESLLRFLPSAEDMGSLRSLKDEYEELCPAEQFAFMVKSAFSLCFTFHIGILINFTEGA